MRSSIPQLPNFATARVLVVGDVMLDRYWYGATSRISPEAPVPIVRVEDVEVRPGGAANVALNVAELGARACLIGAIGTDDAGKELGTQLRNGNVETHLLQRDELTTITKLRVVSRHQQLIRLDFESPIAVEPEQLFAAVRDAAGDPSAATAPGGSGSASSLQALVLSDYGKGTLGAVPKIIAFGRDQGVPVLVDPKGRDFSPYRGASIITPNLAELEAVVGACGSLDSMTERAHNLRSDLALEWLLVTRGQKGMSLFTRDESIHLRAHSRDVFDVTGAGDTVIAMLAAALGAGASIAQATELANLAASIVVGKVGTATVSAGELEGASLRPLPRRGVLSRNDLIGAVAQAQAASETVVMTNGCFDILHPGHVEVLRRAAALGDRLVVAVNDDNSVTRLKGPERPIVSLPDRMNVLAGLASVDWVTSFVEDDPSELIRAVSPDVLIKGGDYTPENIAGADHVLARGGRVEVLEYLNGNSTTDIVESIRGRRLT